MNCQTCDEMRSRIAQLEDLVAWYRDPARYRRDQGHDARCARVHAPRAAHPCTCVAEAIRDVIRSAEVPR